MSLSRDPKFWRAVAQSVKAPPVNRMGNRFSTPSGGSSNRSQIGTGIRQSKHDATGFYVGQTHVHDPKFDEFGKPRAGLTLPHPIPIVHGRIRNPWVTGVFHWPGGVITDTYPYVGWAPRNRDKWHDKHDWAVFGPTTRAWPEYGFNVGVMGNTTRVDNLRKQSPYRNQINAAMVGAGVGGTLYYGKQALDRHKLNKARVAEGLPKIGYKQPFMQNLAEFGPRRLASFNRGFYPQPGDFDYRGPDTPSAALPGGGPSTPPEAPPAGRPPGVRYQRTPDGRIYDWGNNRFVTEDQAQPAARFRRPTSEPPVQTPRPNTPRISGDPFHDIPGGSGRFVNELAPVVRRIGRVLRGVKTAAARPRILSAGEARMAEAAREAAAAARLARLGRGLATTGRAAGRLLHGGANALMGGLAFHDVMYGGDYRDWAGPIGRDGPAYFPLMTGATRARDLPAHPWPGVIHYMTPGPSMMASPPSVPRSRYEFAQHLGTKAAPVNRMGNRFSGGGGTGHAIVPGETPVWDGEGWRWADKWAPVGTGGVVASVTFGAPHGVTYIRNKLRDRALLARDRARVPGGVGPFIPTPSTTPVRSPAGRLIKGWATRLGDTFVHPRLFADPLTGEEPFFWEEWQRRRGQTPTTWQRVPIQPRGPKRPPTIPKGQSWMDVLDSMETQMPADTLQGGGPQIQTPPASPVASTPVRQVLQQAAQDEGLLARLGRLIRGTHLKNDLGPHGLEWNPIDGSAFGKMSTTSGGTGLVVRGRPVRPVRRRPWDEGCGMKAAPRRSRLGPLGPTATPEQIEKARIAAEARYQALRNQPSPPPEYFERQADPPHGPATFRRPPASGPRYHLMQDGRIMDSVTGEVVGAVKPTDLPLPPNTELGPGGRLIDPTREPADYRKLPLGDPRRTQGTVGWVRRGRVLPSVDDPSYHMRAGRPLRTPPALTVAVDPHRTLPPGAPEMAPVQEVLRLPQQEGAAARILRGVTRILRGPGMKADAEDDMDRFRTPKPETGGYRPRRPVAFLQQHSKLIDRQDHTLRAARDEQVRLARFLADESGPFDPGNELADPRNIFLRHRLDDVMARSAEKLRRASLSHQQLGLPRNTPLWSDALRQPIYPLPTRPPFSYGQGTHLVPAASPLPRVPVSALDRTQLIRNPGALTALVERLAQYLRRGSFKAELIAATRNRLPDSAFALPGRRYPIFDENHCRAALQMVGRFGSAREKATVRQAVARRCRLGGAA